MRLENSLQNKQIVITQICLILFVSLMFLKTFALSLIVPAIVVFLTASFIVLQFPQTIVILFLSSFFFGIFFIRYYNVGISPTEIILPLVWVGFLSRLAVQKKSLILNANCKAISYSYWIFVACLILSLICNVVTLPDWFIINGVLVILKFIQYYLAFLIISFICDEDAKVNRFIYALLILSFVQFPIVIFQHFNNFTTGESIGRNVLGTMSYHHGMIGTFMLIPLGLSIGLFFKSRNRNLKFFLVVLSSVFVIQIILSTARSALIGAVGAICFFLLLKFRFKPKYFLFVTFIFILIGSLFYLTPLKSLVDASVNSNTNNGIDVSSLIRLYIWKGGIDFYIGSDWKTKLIGVGTGAYPFITYKQVVTGGLRHAFGGHNNLLTIICETGIVGIIAFCSLWVVVLKCLYRNRRNPLNIAYFYVTIAMLISGLTQETFWVTTAFYNLWTIYLVGLALVLKSASFNGEKNVI